MTDESNDKQVDDWVKILNLKSHPEGGYYSETYRSNDQCTLERYNQDIRHCSTAIYYLLRLPDSPISVFHRIKADEMWHFYTGLPLIIHVLDEKDSSHTEFTLDNRLDVNPNARPQYLVPYGKWFAAEILKTDRKENYTLCGCTCAPGFDYNDFECAKRSYLLEKFPKLGELIIRLTPSD
jgi:predicted cupin superfamily sugar epimerase